MARSALRLSASKASSQRRGEPVSEMPTHEVASTAELNRIGIGRTAEVYAWGEGQVLKLYRPDIPRAWAAREAEIGRIVSEAGLAAPAFVDVVELEGRPGIVYERIAGPSMLDALSRRPWTLLPSARQFASVQAAMHECRRPELPAQRAGLFRAIEHAPALPDAARRRAAQTLSRLPDGDAVCHGDYHPDNIVLSARGPIVIDWMTAVHGNPVADVARTALLLRSAVLPAGMPAAKRLMTTLFRRAFLAAYLRAYRRLRPLPDAEMVAWTPVLAAARLAEGIGAEEAMLLRLAEGKIP
jgi:tRNA A-37 threonylcarbamoyl transferase component Bud32